MRLIADNEAAIKRCAQRRETPTSDHFAFIVISITDKFNVCRREKEEKRSKEKNCKNLRAYDYASGVSSLFSVSVVAGCWKNGLMSVVPFNELDGMLLARLADASLFSGSSMLTEPEP